MGKAVVSAIGQPSKWRVIPSAIALGCILNTGTYSATQNSIPLGSPSFYLTLLFWVIACNLLFIILDVTLNREKNQSIWSRLSYKILNIFELKFELKSLILDTVKVLACWLPYIILLYPGILYWDTGDQLAQYFGISAWDMQPGQIWDHHPFLDAYIYGFFLTIGKQLFSSPEVGVYIYCLAQCLAAALMFVCMVSYIKKITDRDGLIAFAILFYCFFPPIPILFMSAVKDVTHLLFFVPWCLLFIEVVRSDRMSLRLFFLLVLFATLSSLTKKMGLYVILAASLLALLSNIRVSNKLRLLFSTVVVYVISNILIPTFIFPALNIVPGGPQAALALPIQQVARVATAYPEDITDEEREAIDSFLLVGWDDMSENYNPYISDPVTLYNVKDKTKSIDFIKAWVSIGLRHPLVYLNAFFSLESGWISFNSVPEVADPELIEITVVDKNEVEESTQIADLDEAEDSSQIVDTDKVKSFQTVPLQIQVRTSTDVNPDTMGLIYPTHVSSESSDIVNEMYTALLNTPIINMPFYVAIWTAVIPFYCLHAIFYAHRRGSRLSYIALCAPYFLSVCSLFVYAVSLSLVVQDNPTRYMFHTIVLAPLFLSFVIGNRKCATNCSCSTSLDLSSE